MALNLPHHLGSRCLPADPPHQWEAMHAGWNQGAMDGFVKSAGSDVVMGYFDATDLPFYNFRLHYETTRPSHGHVAT